MSLLRSAAERGRLPARFRLVVQLYFISEKAVEEAIPRMAFLLYAELRFLSGMYNLGPAGLKLRKSHFYYFNMV
jgi:hypothetical protein